MRISDWSSDVCSSDLRLVQIPHSALLSIPSFANVARKFSIPSTRSRKQPSACQKRSFAPSAKMASKPFTNEEVEDFIMYTSSPTPHARTTNLRLWRKSSSSQNSPSHRSEKHPSEHQTLIHI